MKLAIELGGMTRRIEIASDAARASGELLCTIDGRAVDADAVEVAPGVYSILIEGASFEARVEPDSTSDPCGATPSLKAKE